MKTRFILVLAAAFALASCGSGGIRLNNPFRKGDETVALAPAGGFPDAKAGRLLIDQVTDLRIERSPGGILVRAIGLPPRLGFWEAELVPENNGFPVEGVLNYAFRIFPPPTNQGTGTEYSRKIFAATFISDAKLAGVTRIQVTGARNSRTVGKR